MADDAAPPVSPPSKYPPGDFPGRLPAPHRHAVKPPARVPGDVPELSLPRASMELFDPERHLARAAPPHGGPSGAAEPLPLAVAARSRPDLLLVPRREDCDALWERYGVLDNVRAHSEKVAELAHAMAVRAAGLGMRVCPDAVLAAGLLHDLAKTYTIHHGGNHAQLGAAWVMRETGNGAIAQAVFSHVYWPWTENADNDDCFLPLAILYADKRTMHDAHVSLDERFEDLLVRYAVNDYARSRIERSHEQGKRVETALSRRLGVNLHEYTADSGRLVKRT